MNKIMNSRERGYSLAEVMVATAIFAIIILAALTIYDRSNRVFKRGVESSNMQQNTRVAFEKVASDLRMAGFDFDRDGIPTGSGSATGGTNAYQQTDEQFEYIGPAAITVRANFDFEAEKQRCITGSVTENCDNGLEGPNYQSAQFPVVTTGNDEIVTYALVPDSQTSIPACNGGTNCVQFYADAHRPRSSYPGGQNENLVQIPGVDLCSTGTCTNPPYTLYRFTLDRDASTFTSGSNVIRTPLASNIRSLNFIYYQDAQGTDPLKDLANTTDVSTGSTIKGDGQWMAASPGALIVNREIRAKVNSLRFVLVGMNETPDGAYTDAADPIAAMKKYRKYRLESLIAPRNVQKRGMREQDTFPPGAPTAVTTCTGYCGGIRISWTAPPVNGTYGAPDQYKIIFGPSAGAGWPCETTTFTNTWAFVFGSDACGSLIPNVSYKFAVVALNSYGSETSAPTAAITPLNTTKPNPPQWVSAPLLPATTTLNGKVTLKWLRPISNASGAYTCGTYPDIPPGEIYGYLVERSSNGTTGWAPVMPITATGKPTISTNTPYDTVTFDDTTAANCEPYFYRVTAVELCAANGAYNNTGTTPIGSSSTSTVVPGQATSSAAPKAPSTLAVSGDTLATGTNCNATSSPLVCQPTLTWPAVGLDVSDVPIHVAHYRVYRRDPPATTFVQEGTVDNPPVGAMITYNGQMVDVTAGVTHEYRVTALQCDPATGESTPSPVRTWPCPFPTNLLLSPPLTMNSFDGNGTTTSPWLLNDTATVGLSYAAAQVGQIQYIKYRVYTQAGALKTESAQLVPGTANWSQWTWTVDPNQIEHVIATVVTTGGCSAQVDGWVQDEPQGCCIRPFSLDPTIVAFSAGTSFIDVTLKNICSNTLALNSVSITFDPNKTGNGGKLSGIVFPGGGTVSFNTNSGTATANAPGATTPIPIGGVSTYKIRLTFSKNLSQNPLLTFNAAYNNVTPSCAIK